MKKITLSKLDSVLWKMFTDERVQIWPKQSSITYLTKPTKYMPCQFVNNGKISVPKKFCYDFAEEVGIESAAFASHKKGFYISREETDTSTLIYVLSGRYKINVDGKKYELKKGMLLIPTFGSLCEDSANGDVEVLWFRLLQTPFWENLIGNRTRVIKAKYISQIFTLSKMYSDEMRADFRDAFYLKNIASLIMETIRRELQLEKKSKLSSEEKIYKRLFSEKNMTLSQASKLAGLETKRLNVLFKKRYGATFSKIFLKIKMERALGLLMTGKTLKFIASQTGFSDAYSFSSAFKRYYGSSPKKFLSTDKFDSKSKLKP